MSKTIENITTTESQGSFRVRRGRVDSVDLFEIKENELDRLEKGQQADLYLNFSIFLFSLCFSSILALVTATFKKEIFQTLFLCTSIISVIGGTFLLILWIYNRQGIKAIIRGIRSRIPPDSATIETDKTSITIVKEEIKNKLPPDELILPSG